ncbi:MAG: glycosyltransferase family 2 protein [Clostridiales bacterium]|nr:glycosyltransferase family 2 protein [Clostridiales bacterium]
MERKKISVMIPTYFEEENVVPIAEAVINQFQTKLANYDYEIVFIDNCSQDKTREKIEQLCKDNKNIKAIFNVRNFGQFNSPYYGICQTTGDCTIPLCADFQDPVEMIPVLVNYWEQGYKIVCAVKKTSKENKIVRLARSIYYKLIKKMSDVDQIEHFTGFGLYDKSFVDVLRNLDEPVPFIRGIVAELGFKKIEIPYEQQKRRAGKSSNNFSRLYDAAMLSFTSYTKTPIRFITFFGIFSFFLALAGFIACGVLDAFGFMESLRFIYVIEAVMLFSGINLAAVGVIGEYVLSIKNKVTKRPLVIEERRINFEKQEKNHLN